MLCGGVFLLAVSSYANIHISTHTPTQITYTSAGFLEKNRDTLPGGAVGLMQSSTNELVRSIFLGLWQTKQCYLCQLWSVAC